jgi:SNF2 family DNA or RNA helicase
LQRISALEGRQAALYESIRLSMEKKVRDAITKRGVARSQITILDALLKLRQVCCDPRLVSLKERQSQAPSAKLSMLLEMVPELLDEGRRILLFSQFTSMLGLIEQALKKVDIPYCKLTGQTRKREQAIDAFRNGEVNFFLISLKAGGVGLNLIEADTVIHYDPWWNPAVEAQATDRAHRIGQDKPVFVYKLLTEGTVEEKILALQEKKRKLADSVYGKGKKGGELLFDAETIEELLAG